MEDLKTKKNRPDPKVCEHRSITRILDSWECTECHAEFVPKDKAHKTKWIHPPKFKDCPTNYT